MPDTKLIMVEGIPGSGKSTSAAKIKEHLDKKNIPSKLYLEADFGNPADYAWISVMPEAEFHTLLMDNPSYGQAFDRYSEREDGKVLIYYQKLIQESGLQIPGEIVELFNRYEPYDGKLPADEFCRLHLNRYRRFSR